MRRGGLKPVVLIELSGLLVKGVHEKGSHSGVSGYGHCAMDGVLQQRRSEMLSLPPAVDREPGENHDRNRIQHVATHAARGELVRNGPGGQGVVAEDKTVLIADDEGARRAARLIGQCPALEPFVERGPAAVEVVEPM